MINCSQPDFCMFFNNFICGGSTFTKELNSSFEKVIADAKEMPTDYFAVRFVLNKLSPSKGRSWPLCKLFKSDRCLSGRRTQVWSELCVKSYQIVLGMKSTIHWWTMWVIIHVQPISVELVTIMLLLLSQKIHPNLKRKSNVRSWWL